MFLIIFFVNLSLVFVRPIVTLVWNEEQKKGEKEKILERRERQKRMRTKDRRGTKTKKRLNI